MDILFLSHCVPNPPDKGEKIRAYHELLHLAGKHRVHLACLARNVREMRDAEALKGRCASVEAELFHPRLALAKAALRFAAGACLTTSFYRSEALARRVAALAATTRFDAVVVYSAAMASYVPRGIPALLDLVDVDSEKWLAYARMRRGGFVYGMEGRRLRKLEGAFAEDAACCLLATGNELEVFRRFSADTRARAMENGVDFDYFDAARTPDEPSLAGRRFVVFVGAMKYYPNADAALWFAEHALPELQRRVPGMEFLIVGRGPTAAVRALASKPGIQVTGAVPDVRPYLKASAAVVAPLRIARGVQNKVLEALAMGKTVLASRAVCQTLEPVPRGLIECGSANDYAAGMAHLAADAAGIRAGAQQRFCWNRNMETLTEELCRLSEHNRMQLNPAAEWARSGS